MGSLNVSKQNFLNSKAIHINIMSYIIYLLINSESSDASQSVSMLINEIFKELTKKCFYKKEVACIKW